MELGMPYTADAVENARVVEVNGELQFTAGKADLLALRPEDRYPTARATSEALRMFLAKRASLSDRRPRF